MSARRISFVNFKGGVGKTSLTVNLAACLAHEYKQRILLVDCDAQSNSSIWLMGINRWSLINEQPEKTIYSIFMDANFVASLNVIVQKSVLRDGETKEALIPTLDLLPATYTLMDLEHEYQNVSNFPHYFRFNDRLSQFFDQYDYIFFDCPPNVFRASQCAIFNSEEIYVPCNPDQLSYIGLSLLGRKIEQFQNISTAFQSLAVDYRHALIRGIILNSVQGNADFDDIIQKIRTRILQMRQWTSTADDADVLPRRIRQAVHAGKVVEHNLPVILSKGNNALKDDYMSLAEYIHRKPYNHTSETKTLF